MKIEEREWIQVYLERKSERKSGKHRLISWTESFSATKREYMNYDKTALQATKSVVQFGHARTFEAELPFYASYINV